MEKIFVESLQNENVAQTLENTVFIVKILLAIYPLLSDICT